MAELKTKINDSSVDAFLNKVADEQKRKDSYELIKLLKKITTHEAKMWGPSIIGFDSYYYKYDSGHGGEMPLVGFSPRKASITLYLMCGFHGHEALKRLGKHKTGKGCLYINKLADVDMKALEELIRVAIVELKKHVAEMKAKNG